MRELPDDIRAVEATLFAAEEAMSEKEIADYVGEGVDVAAAIEALADPYAGRGVNLVERGKRWHVQTAPDMAPLLRREWDAAGRTSAAAIGSAPRRERVCEYVEIS